MLASFVHPVERRRQIAAAIELFDFEVLFADLAVSLAFVKRVEAENHAVGGKNHEAFRIHVDERHHHALVGRTLGFVRAC